MSQAVVDGLRRSARKRVAVTTAYTDEVNQRLKEFLEAQGFEVLSLEGFGLFGFGGPARKSETDIIDAERQGGERGAGADGAADLVRRPAHARRRQAARGAARLPVVSTTPAAFWAAMRLVGESGHVAGHGRLLEQAAAAPVHEPIARRLCVARCDRCGSCAVIARAWPVSTDRLIEGGRDMKARVTVTLKSGILDPQGKAIEGALKSLGVDGVASVRQGKVFDIEIEGSDRKQAEAALKAGGRQAPRQYGDREL